MSNRAKKAAIAAVFISLILTPVLIILDEYVDFQKWLPDIPAILSTGLIPLVLVLSLVLLFHFGIKITLKLSDAEAFQTSAVFLITAFVILTLTCAWLRGAGMKLILGST